MPRPSRTRLAVSVALALGLVLAACAEPDLGPPSSTSVLPEASPTPESEEAEVLSLPPVTATATPTPTPTPSPTPTVEPEEPRVPEPGLTDDVMTLAVIADVSTGAAGGEGSRAAWDAVEAWAASVNDAGGLAERQVVVQFIDTGTFNHADAIAEVCSGDVFAIVGSYALYDDEGIEALLDPECSLPDFLAAAVNPKRRDWPVTYMSNPFLNDLVMVGPYQYHAELFPDAVSTAATMFLEFPATIINGERTIEAATSTGWNFVYAPTVTLDEDYVPHAEAMAANGVEALVWGADGARYLELRQALTDAGVELTVADCGPTCYSATFAEQAGALGEGTTTWITTVPFEESDTNFELTRYLFWLQRVEPDAVPDAIGVNAWAAGLLFEEAVNRAVGTATPEYDPAGLTRQSVLNAAETITAWDARGLHGVANPADGIPSPCFVVMTLLDGEWVRTFPFGSGNADCDQTNIFTLQQTADLGLEESTLPTPSTSDDPVDDGALEPPLEEGAAPGSAGEG